MLPWPLGAKQRGLGYGGEACACLHSSCCAPNWNHMQGRHKLNNSHSDRPGTISPPTNSARTMPWCHIAPPFLSFRPDTGGVPSHQVGLQEAAKRGSKSRGVQECGRGGSCRQEIGAQILLNCAARKPGTHNWCLQTPRCPFWLCKSSFVPRNHDRGCPPS